MSSVQPTFLQTTHRNTDRHPPSAPTPSSHASNADHAIARGGDTIAPGGRRRALVDALLEHVPAGDRAAARTAIPAIIDAARACGNSDPNRLGYLLATAQTESDFGANMVEGGHSKQWFERNYGHDDGNRPGTADGYTYRGRGYVQVTHAGRYAELSHTLGLPDVPARVHGEPILDSAGKPKLEPALVADPDRLTDPRLAARALVIGVTKNLFTHNAHAAIERTIPTGRPPGNVDFFHARALVNGIVQAQAHAIAANAATYARILNAFEDTPVAALRKP